MTLKERASDFYGHSEYWWDEGDIMALIGEKDGFVDGAEWAIKKALEVLDSMFMDRASISVDDWFQDSPNLFQGRKEFKKRMSE